MDESATPSTEQVAALVKDALDALVKHASTAQEPSRTKDLFFPDGIGYIHAKVVGPGGISVELDIASSPPKSQLDTVVVADPPVINATAHPMFIHVQGDPNTTKIAATFKYEDGSTMNTTLKAGPQILT
jgi:hypothetical protein